MTKFSKLYLVLKDYISTDVKRMSMQITTMRKHKDVIQMNIHNVSLSFQLLHNVDVPIQRKTSSTLIMNSMKLVIPLHFISWKKTPNDAVAPQRQSQFTPKMKANAVPRLLSSLV